MGDLKITYELCSTKVTIEIPEESPERMIRRINEVAKTLQSLASTYIAMKKKKEI